jgi:hypothetical protein
VSSSKARQLEAVQAQQEFSVEQLQIYKRALSEAESRLDAARRFCQGLLYARQWLYASFDLSLTGPTPGPAMAVWERMEAASLLGHVPGTAFPGTFGHIVGGYAPNLVMEHAAGFGSLLIPIFGFVGALASVSLGVVVCDELGEIVLQRAHDPFHLVARPARKRRGCCRWPSSNSGWNCTR